MSDGASHGDGFVARWSRRKLLSRRDGALGAGAATSADPTKREAAGADAAEGAPPATRTVAPSLQPPPPNSASATPALATAAAAPPTLDDVAALTPDSDFSRFVARDVDGDVRNAALKKLFADPRFQAMDGLDVYIADYSRPDPLPAAALRRMAQAAALGLIDAETEPNASLPQPHGAVPSARPDVEATATDDDRGPTRDEDAHL